MPTDTSDLQPLGLTVHTPPSVQSLSEGSQALSQRKGRWKMLAVLLVCAAPVIASYWTYYMVRPEGRRNFGELVEPQQPIPATLMATTLQGQTVPLSDWKGQWLLISTANAACDATCEGHLYLQRQLRESLGREKDRVDWMWLIPDGQVPAPELQKALQSAQVLQVDAAALQSWLQPAQGHALSEHLYLVDPLGNWMMRFPANMDASQAAQAKRDLVRLLRASSAWDQPGR